MENIKFFLVAFSRKIFLFVPFALCACDSMVRFETAQPEGIQNEKSIPKKMVGTYRSLKDSSVVTITKEFIISSVDVEFAGLISEMDSIDRPEVTKDTSFSEIDYNMRLDVSVRGDSVFQSFTYKDTIFNFNTDDVLRKYKGYYFLNRQTAANSWYVTKLGRTKEGVVLGEIWNRGEIAKLHELTSTKSDSVYQFSPSKKQFRKFLKENGFADVNYYVKIE